MPPPVGIIVTTYNRARLVTRAIDSVLADPYPDLAVLVIDDGSTDDTPSVLARYEADPRVHLVRIPRNVGVTAAKNAGLDRLAEDVAYAAFVDSDDLLVPGAIGRLVSVFEATADRYSQVLGWCEQLDSGADAGRMSHRSGVVTYDDALAGRFSGEFMHLVRRDLLGARRFDERAAGGESAVWWPLLKLRPGWLLPEVVKRYAVTGDDRVTAAQWTRRAAEGRMWALHAGLSPVARDLARRHPDRYAALLVELAKWAALAGDGPRARAAARKALRARVSGRALVMLLVSFVPAGLLRRLARWRSGLRR